MLSSCGAGKRGGLRVVVAHVRAWLKRHPAVFASCWSVDRKWCGHSVVRSRRHLVGLRRYGGSWWGIAGRPASWPTVISSLQTPAAVAGKLGRPEVSWYVLPRSPPAPRKLAHREVSIEAFIDEGGLICISTYAVSRWMCEAAGRMLGRPGIAVEAVIGWSTRCAL